MLAALRQFFGAQPASQPSPRPLPGYPLIILGMHRSGTSFLTGTLQMAGLELGAHSTANTHNAKGNRENPGIVAFHNDVLAARGGDWKTLPEQPVIWTPEERRGAEALVASFDRTAPWGFKDPRALLMLDSWLALCPDARFIGIFRNPTAVFRSLHSRNAHFTEERAQMLWAGYNQRLLALHEQSPFPLFCFDDDPALLQDRINAVLPGLGLQPLGAEMFFSAGLRHHDAAPDMVPPHLAPLYAALKDRQT